MPEVIESPIAANTTISQIKYHQQQDMYAYEAKRDSDSFDLGIDMAIDRIGKAISIPGASAELVDVSELPVNLEYNTVHGLGFYNLRVALRNFDPYDRTSFDTLYNNLKNVTTGDDLAEMAYKQIDAHYRLINALMHLDPDVRMTREEVDQKWLEFRETLKSSIFGGQEDMEVDVSIVATFLSMQNPKSLISGKELAKIFGTNTISFRQLDEIFDLENRGFHFSFPIVVKNFRKSVHTGNSNPYATAINEVQMSSEIERVGVDAIDVFKVLGINGLNAVGVSVYREGLSSLSNNKDFWRVSEDGKFGYFQELIKIMFRMHSATPAIFHNDLKLSNAAYKYDRNGKLSISLMDFEGTANEVESTTFLHQLELEWRSLLISLNKDTPHNLTADEKQAARRDIDTYLSKLVTANKLDKFSAQRLKLLTIEVNTPFLDWPDV